MKPFNLEICLKCSKLIWKRSIPKTNKIFVILKSGVASKLPPLGSVLGTYGVNADNFCNEFNMYSLQTYNKNVPMRMLIEINPTKTFKMIINKLPWYLLLKRFSFLKKLPKKIKFKLVQKKPERVYKFIFLSIFYKLALVILLQKLQKQLNLDPLTSLYNDSQKKFIIKLIKQNADKLHTYDLHDIGEKPLKRTYKRKKR